MTAGYLNYFDGIFMWVYAFNQWNDTAVSVDRILKDFIGHFDGIFMMEYFSMEWHFRQC